MPSTDIKHEYEQGHRWRMAWLALANKFEPNRLQSKQERIERRAVLANSRVGRAMRTATKVQSVPTPMSAPANASTSEFVGMIAKALDNKSAEVLEGQAADRVFSQYFTSIVEPVANLQQAQRTAAEEHLQPKKVNEVDMLAALAEKVRAGEPVYVRGPLDDAAGKLHLDMVNRLRESTGRAIHIIHI